MNSAKMPAASRIAAAERIRSLDRKAVALMAKRPDLSFSECWKLVLNAEESDQSGGFKPSAPLGQ